MELVLISSFCSVLKADESFDPPGWDTNRSQVSSQQMLVLIYLPQKDGKLSKLRQERKSHKDSNFSRAKIKPTNCANHSHPSYYIGL